MNTAVVSLKQESIEGPAPVGSQLSAVMRRFGVYVDKSCDRAANHHECAVVIISGDRSLSPLTPVETEHFGESGRKSIERLACEAVITAAGEITIMTKEKKAAETKEAAKETIVDEFTAMPLEEKLSNLVRMEAVALGETLEFVINSPMKVFEKIGDALAEIGMKIDAEAKKTTARTTEPADAEKPKAAKPKTTTRRPTRAKKPAADA